jgi:hypothetical protein
MSGKHRPESAGRLRRAAAVLSAAFLCSNAFGQGIVIGNGGSLVISNASVRLNCNDVRVEAGGRLSLSNATMLLCRDFALDSGAAFDADGTLWLGATWENHSTFVAPPAFTVLLHPVCGDQHLALGTGDADADGITDRGEGVGDVDGDGKQNFIDPTTTWVLRAPPGAWLRKHGLPLDHSADFADTDGDGMNNYAEFLCATDPRDRGSVLAVEAIRGALVKWQSVANKRYSLQRATRLMPAPDFTTVRGNIVGISGSTSASDTTEDADSAYYRVTARP